MFRKAIRFIFKCLLGLVFISIGLVLVFKWVPVPVTPLMVIRAVEQKQAGKEVVWEHDWVSIGKISKNLQLAVVCSEDQKFVEHKGFDVEAIEKVIRESSNGGRMRGASTISQQTAKNVFLWPERSWFRKGLEAYFTFLIEMFWSKERILEVYLNSIEMGKGIYGAEAASQFWFKKQASGLSQYEAAAIAAILPNPQLMKANPASVYVQSRKEWIVRQMNYYGPFTLPK
ncbi:monofunctional biosynthetic peptidoglycan transglycosylase [Galbibacter sp. EGI 63066]|uniref:monofunctional biosynthetic peptidoglycan transglycosylase n=1 Tax=Galbibacter sp. EGI 63066 TaxID=2993559 RepID=UPI0022490002|nr:monofunctional biosynthetic peptidoglycan transglycosylase [Galbibacter sp. EGI 63066]MCX2678975.1 monofunctional biosynthetic peptidoglycan transglycosylase [Galbibacter sp. EGI 63066]